MADKSLVIVESPAKAKTISKYLGKEYIVKSSVGHVRKLPKGEKAIDRKDWSISYEIDPKKTKVVKELNVDNLPGGISGLAIKNKSNELLKFVKKNLNEEKILVAVGGVFDVDSYNEKIEMGADLVEMYTGLVYQGPNQVRRIVKNGR